MSLISSITSKSNALGDELSELTEILLATDDSRCIGQCPDNIRDDSEGVNPEWVAMQQEEETGRPIASPAMLIY